MKKKIFLFIAVLAMLTCLFAIVANAETPSLYIQFDVKLSGNDNYTTAYVQNPEAGNPRVNLTFDFYSDLEFTQVIDKNNIVAMDFSGATHYGNSKDYVDRFTTADASVYPNCTEIKWFSRTFTKTPSNTFNGWTQLKKFDFGCITVIDYGFLANTGLEEVVIPASVTVLNNGVFQNCASLKTVKIEGGITSMGSNQFGGCTSLTSLDLGSSTMLGENMCNGCTSLTSVTVPSTVTEVKSQAFYNCTGLTSVKISEGVSCVGESMFYNCSALTSISLPSTITEIKGGAFKECTALTSITIPENVTKIGNAAFHKAGITSLHIPAKVEYLGYQVAEESKIVSLTFAENSSLKHIDHRAFMKCTSLEGVVIIPDGVEDIEYGLFSSCSKLKAVKIPDSVYKSTETGAFFSSCSSLEYVQLSKNLTTISGSMFENCSSLKAISIPEGVTIMGNKSLRNCQSLQAIYLPSTLTALGVASSGDDKGVFYQSKNIYFVQEEFNVFNGNELIGDNFIMPEKPNVYYMPKNLNFLGNSEFQNCNKLNSYIVFPEGVTSAAGCVQGAFHHVGNSTSPVTVIFLGDMTAFNIRQNDASYSNISFVFANPNDKDLNSLTLTIGSSGTNKLQTNTYIHFCASNVVYDLSTFKAENNTVYTVLETDFAKTTEKQQHIAEPSKTVVTDPTCIKGRGETMYCFCGAYIGFTEVEGTSLGHDYNVANGAKNLSIVYENYLANGILKTQCSRCDVTEESTANAIITSFKGYSLKENGNGITFGYTLDLDALALYNEVNNTSLEYGFVVAAKAFVQGDAPLNDDGSVAKTSQGNVVKVNISSINYTAADFKLTGTWNTMVDLDGDNVDETDIKTVEFYMSGYIYDGSVSYISNNEATSTTANVITYNNIP